MPVREAASISSTSTSRSSGIATQCSQTPQGSMVGPPVPSGPMQLRARAMMRAVVVLPTPRTPVSMKAWAMRPVAKALGRVRTMRFLADQAGEIDGAVFAGEDAIGKRFLGFRHGIPDP